MVRYLACGHLKEVIKILMDYELRLVANRLPQSELDHLKNEIDVNNFSPSLFVAYAFL